MIGPFEVGPPSSGYSPDKVIIFGRDQLSRRSVAIGKSVERAAAASSLSLDAGGEDTV